MPRAGKKEKTGIVIEIVEAATMKIARRIDCRGKNPATVDRLEGEAWIKMDHEKFFTRRTRVLLGAALPTEGTACSQS